MIERSNVGSVTLRPELLTCGDCSGPQQPYLSVMPVPDAQFHGGYPQLVRVTSNTPLPLTWGGLSVTRLAAWDTASNQV
jgi:hypothetical protein